MTNDSQAASGISGSDAGDAPRNILIRLRQLTLFSQLDDDQFALVCRLLRSREVSRGELVFEQGNQDTNLYVLRRGSVAARNIDANHREHFVGKLKMGAIFNETAFISGSVNEHTVEALENLVLWYISRAEFDLMQRAHPQIAVSLVKPNIAKPVAQSVAIPHRHRYQWQRADEEILLYRKKHWWVFMRTLWVIPVTLILLAVLTIPPIFVVAQFFYNALAIVLGIFLIGYTAVRFMDWQNDYYAISNQRVLHRERVLFFRDDQEEVPMNKIQDVRVDRPSFFTMLFDFGNVTLDAAGTRTRVRFDDIPKPQEVAKVIFEQMSVNKVVVFVSDHAKIRQDLRSELALGAGEQEQIAAARSPRLDALPMMKKRWRSFRATMGALRNTALPRMRLVEGHTITYRKHWLQLLKSVGIPLIALALLVASIIITRLVSADLSVVLLTIPGLCIVFLFGLGMALWLWYMYEDWRNDIYQLTPERIVDIDRSPLGLFGTSKREARLSMVQNVTSKTHGVIDLFFNMGDVLIQTASGDGKLTFERVHNPRRVAHEIVEYIDAFDATVRELEAAQRRTEMTEWFGVYDELRRLHEAKKID